MILSSRDIQLRLKELVVPAREMYINPASLDIRLGSFIIDEAGNKIPILHKPYLMEPGEFVLVETLEKIMVPNDLAVELRLKSSVARQGYNHSLAFWFDPGWYGNGTMEVSNLNRTKKLPLSEGMLFAQLIFHQLSSEPLSVYGGRYQGATSVEEAKV